MPKKDKPNLALQEAEIKKEEELNRRKAKMLAERAELLRQEKELDAAEHGGEETPNPARPFSFADEQFLKVVDSLTGGGSIHISRVTGSGVAKVATFPIVDAQTMEQQVDSIARKYGGGTFLVELRNSDGTYAKQKQVTFDEKAYAPPADPGAQVNAAQNQLMTLMMESRRESNELLKTLLTALVANKPQAPVNSVQDIAAIAALFKGQGGGAFDQKSTLDMITKAMTWGRELAEGKTPGESDGEPNVLKDMVQPFLAILSEVVKKAPPKPAALPSTLARPGTMPRPLPSTPEGAFAPGAVPAVPAAPAEAAAPIYSEAVVDPTIEAVRSNFFYKMYVPTLLKAAVEKQDVEDVALDVLSTVPTTHHGVLLKLAQSPDVVEYLAKFEPEARNHAEWIKGVVDIIVEELTADEDELGEEIEAPKTAAGNGHGPVPAEALVKKGG
jgi:hypothetical protein